MIAEKNLMKPVMPPLLRLTASVSFVHALFWAFLFLRWLTFSAFHWTAYPAELALSQQPALAVYLLYALLGAADLAVALAYWQNMPIARPLGLGRAAVVLLGCLIYFYLTKEFYGGAIVFGLAGFLLILQLDQPGWAVAYPAGYWLGVFFIAPLVIVFVVSLGERSLQGTVTYPTLGLDQISSYFNDYIRFFSPVNGTYIYLIIFARSVWTAVLNTVLCLIIGFPFAFWIARQPAKNRNLLVFLVMIPFWTNFLVRTYAWMLILRDSGLINNFWTITLHEQAVYLAGESGFFAWLAKITDHKLPLLFNQQAVLLGLLYGYLPFMVLPLYTTLEKFDWALLEAAADLGANTLQSTLRVLIPLALPGIVAGSIIVFIPSLGTYVVSDLMGGSKAYLIGNLLQQQFMVVRDWPFGAAIGFIMMAIMLGATILYFRSLARNEQLYNGR